MGVYKLLLLLFFVVVVVVLQEYMSEKGFVHRDLAARNILVGDKNIVKIADFGMTRHLYGEVYQIEMTKRLPIKWMPPEVLRDLVFTTQSDM